MKKLRLLLPMILIAPLLSGCKTFIKYSHYDNADAYLAGSQVYDSSLEGVRSIDIDWRAGEVTLIENYDIDTISITEKDCFVEKAQVHSLYVDGNLTIKYMASDHFAKIDPADKWLKVEYNPSQLSFASIVLSSGTLNANSITTQTAAEIEIKSGELNISNNLVGIDVKVTVSSGDITVQNLYAQNADFRASSGSITVFDTQATNLNIAVSSGTITFHNIDAQEVNAEASSGTINLYLNNWLRGRANASSGSIKLFLPGNGGIIYTKVSSGKVYVNRQPNDVKGGTYYFGDSTSEFEASVSSGTIVIN